MNNPRSTSLAMDGAEGKPYALCPDCRPLGRCALGIHGTFRASDGCRATETGRTKVYEVLKEKDKDGKPAVRSFDVAGKIVDGASWCKYIRSKETPSKPSRKKSKRPTAGDVKPAETTNESAIPVPPPMNEAATPTVSDPPKQTIEPLPPPPPPPPPPAPDQSDDNSNEEGS